MRQAQQPEFFLDRNVGRHVLPALLRATGWQIRTHHKVYAGRDQNVEDVEWLQLCGLGGLVVITADRRIRHRGREIAAIRRYRTKVFVVGGNLSAADTAARLERNRQGIVRACSARGPFVYSVQPDRIVRLFP
ncbi:MAG TPA: hypothetical protein VHC45_11395 [Gaiellaceae bacterium]|nr:hypothetical protein [Gaiellaceae bacterium]